MLTSLHCKSIRERGIIQYAESTLFRSTRIYSLFITCQRIGLIGGALITSVWGRFIRRPPLNMGRLFGLSSFAAFAGASLGTGFQVRAGIQAVNSLENPDRFKKALVEMSHEVLAQRQAALRRPPGSQPGAPVPQDGEHTKLADGWDTGSVRQPPSTPSSASLSR
jgi:hypothetical protein